MTIESDVRANLKLALVDLDAAREGRRAGYAAMTTPPAMHSLEQRVQESSDEVGGLIQELSSEQCNDSPPLPER